MNQNSLQSAFESVLDSMGLDWRNDPNMHATPKRLAKMWVTELCAGITQERPTLAEFPNTENTDELFTVGPIPVRSVCAHHFMPVIGSCWVGVVPGDKLLGLSKYARLVHWVMSRPTLQEDATMMIANELERLIGPLGLGVTLRLSHGCVTMRGVKNENSLMTTSVTRGCIREDHSARLEYLALLKGQGF